MRKVKVFLCLLLLTIFSTNVFAQGNVIDDIELTRTYIETNRKTIIANSMNLTQEQSENFWKVYGYYRNAMKKVNDRFIKLIKDFANNYKNPNQEKAMEILLAYLNIEEDRLLHKRIYIDNFMDVLPADKVARFFQIENKLDSIIKFDLAVQVPLFKTK